MSQKEVQVLLIEDNPVDARMVNAMLAESGTLKYKLECVDRLSTGVERLNQGGVDVVLLDLSLPDAQGMDALVRVQLEHKEVPIIVLSNTDAMTLDAVKLGAQDCLPKGQAYGALLARSILYAIERKSAEERIKQLNEDRERRIMELASANRDLDSLTRKLAQARDQALEASNFKSEFVAKISHEIRTPISAVIGMIDFLLDTPLNSEQKEFANIISDSANNLLAIINDILDLSKMEAGKTELEVIDFSPISLIEGSAELLSSMAKEKRLSLLTFVDPELPTLLKGDPVRLRQIMLNLASNAVKFTEAGLVLIRMIKESETDTAVNVRFDVSDTGIGLSDEARRRLFQPFVQADGTIARRYGGTGLGLAISKRLVELMKGDVGLESEEGEGSTFWFKVALKKSDTTKATNSAFLAAAAANLRDIRVLTVDSDVVSRDILHKYLQAAKVNGDWVSNAQEGLDLLRRNSSFGQPYDVAIIGLGPASQGSFELSKSIKNDPAISSTKLILLSAFEEKGQGEKAIEEGFSGYLSQPVRQSLLIETLARVTGRTAREVTISKSSATPSGNAAPAFRTNGTVLLAEDNPALRELALRQLKKLGLSAHAVSTGKEAIEAVSKKPYSLVLMDCQMPEMDGFEATKLMREKEKRSGQHMPIIAMTASAMHGDRETCIAAGMDDYVSKPVSIETLHKILERWIPAEKTPEKREAPAAVAISESPIDFARLSEIYGDEEVNEILQLFVPEADRLLETAIEAIRSQDTRSLQSTAHQLKGLTASVAAAEMAEASLRLETAAKQSDWEAAEVQQKSLRASYEKVLKFVEKLLPQS
jgi:two-component system, sensor histidine kinase and response regulator